MTSPPDLASWLQHLERLHPSTIELGLDRVQQVYQRLQLDLSASLVVTVGGTNGKGSSVTMLASILRAAGYSVATYTSPHLLHYNERVSINGHLATDAQLCAGFAAVEAARGELSLTYFEFGTLAALWLFAQQQPQVIVLEVGLGGRLDAVNIIDAHVSLLTNVALDHMDWLGDTREKIGTEKAGIFRPGRPAVYGEVTMPSTVAAYAEQQQVPLLRQGQQFGWQQQGQRWTWFGEDQQGQRVELHDLAVNDFPLDNASAVLQVLHKLPVQLARVAIDTGLSNAVIAGRFQRAQYQGIPLVLDVAHNPHAARNLAHNIRTRLAGHKVLLVLGMLADKDSRGVVELLLPTVSHSYLASLGGERGARSEVLYNHARELGFSAVSQYGSVASALAAACAEAQASQNQQPVLVITGSFFTVSAVLELV